MQSSYFDNTTKLLDELAERIAKGRALMESRISRGMDVSGLARQIEYDMDKAAFIVVDVTDTFNQPYPECN
jgi:hypothetical protein